MTSRSATGGCGCDEDELDQTGTGPTDSNAGQGWLESVEKPEGVDATLIKKGEYRQFWRWCDHRSSGRFQALDGEPRCGLCGKKPTGTEGIA